MIRTFALFLLAIPALSQGTRPLDVHGINEMTWGLPLSHMQALYPQLAQVPPGKDKTAPTGLIARLRAAEFPVGDETAVLTLYSRPGEYTLAGLVLIFPDIDGPRGKAAFRVFAKLYGSPQTSAMPTAESYFGSHCEWRFRSTTITLRWEHRWDLVAEFTPRVDFKLPEQARK